MTNHRRPNASDWGAGVIAGTALGAVILGVGGRAGMRVIAIAQGQAPSFSLEGSIVVVLLGAAAGAVVGVLFLLSRVASPRRRPLRVALFWVLVAAFVFRGLDPITTLNVAVFAPLFLLHGTLLFAYWCRIRFRGTALPRAALTPDARTAS